ncbi:MAG: leucyl/phenylalanyl-tRNA--protein transferase [Alphaproteobacteria bacterium]
MFLSTHLVLKAYERGLFPMSDSNNDPYIYWVEPKERGIIDLQEFKVPKSLKKIIKKNNYEIKINSRFEDVIKLCAKNRYRNTSWINNQIIENYTKLNKLGFAKSVEYYFNKKLVGGLYGIILGKIFCGESMFSLVPNASKISLVYLAVLLKENGFKFIDTQFYSDHLKQFGTKKISKKDYQNILKKNFKKKNIIFRDSLKKILKSYF